MNYKLALLLIALLSNVLTIFSQNEYRVGENLTLKRVSLVASTDSKGKGNLWDFSNLTDTLNELNLQYFVNKDTSVCANIASFDQENKFLYHLMNDSMLLVGVQNRNVHIKYELPELDLHFPISYGDFHIGYFSAKGDDRYGDFVRIFGKYKYEVPSIGTLVTMEGDTLRNTLLVHNVRLVSSKFERKESLLLQYGGLDSIPDLSKDMLERMVSKDTTMLQNDIYRWYAPGYRYPIFRQEKISSLNGTVLYSAAYYCPIDSQDALDDEENMKIRKNKSRCSDDNQKKNELLKNGDFNFEIESSRYSLTLNFDLTDVANVSYGIYTTEGMVLFYKKIGSLLQGQHSVSINISSISLHDRVLTLFVNDIPYSKKIK